MKPEDKAVVQQALAVMQRIESADAGGGFLNASQADQLEEAITALRQLLEQPTTEDSSEVEHGDELTIAYLDGVHTGKKMVKREWVGLMRGVRVDGDTVVISTKNNHAARHLCALLLYEKGDAP